MKSVRSDQRSLGFRADHCHLQLTSVDIYIKLLATYNRKRKAHKVLFTILCKNNRNDYW